MQQWASVIGLVLTGLGIGVGFYLPRKTSYYGKDAKGESRLQLKFKLGIALVLSGTALQIIGAWPL